MQNKWAGADVAKDNFEAALSHDGTTRSFPNSPAGAAAFLMWASSMPGFSGHIAMEATGIYSRQLAQYLLDLGAHPAIVNPGHIHAYGRSFGRRNKTDKSTHASSPALPTSASPACGKSPTQTLKPSRSCSKNAMTPNLNKTGSTSN